MLKEIKEILTLITWPFLNLYYIFFMPKDYIPTKPTADTISPLEVHIIHILRSVRSFLMSYFCIYYLYDGENYPGFGRAKKFEIEWILPILLRNIAAIWLIAGFSDWLLYFSPLKDKMKKYKLVEEYPEFKQFVHDAFYCHISVVMKTGMEASLCYLWSNNIIEYDKDLFQAPYKSLALILLMKQVFREPHFYVIHRLIHPWRTKNIPDLGKSLYYYVHSLHHKSYNPSSFNGLSMHPIESFIYFTAAYQYLAFKCHPTIAIGCLVDLSVAAWISHDGFQWPGSGAWYHILHHLYYEGNYGNPLVPFDYLFGTFIEGKEDFDKIWGNEDKPIKEK